MISIFIPTADRPAKLKNCLISITKNTYKDWEAFVIDQSNHNDSKKIIQKIDNQKIHYFKIKEKNKSKAVNRYLSKAKGEIIAFTDDDCIVTQNWLDQIIESFKEDNKIAGIFGNIYPYKNKKKYFCPSTFIKNKKKFIANSNLIHYKKIGLGNNMAFKTEVFKKIGGFREWLGPGSLSHSAFEGEFIYRVLKNKYLLFFNPKVEVFHDRWLDFKQENYLQCKYSCGIMAFYFYYLFKGDFKIINQIKQRIKERIINALKPRPRSIKDNLGNFYYVFREFVFMIKGSVIGALFSLRYLEKMQKDNKNYDFHLYQY